MIRSWYLWSVFMISQDMCWAQDWIHLVSDPRNSSLYRLQNDISGDMYWYLACYGICLRSNGYRSIDLFYIQNASILYLEILWNPPNSSCTHEWYLLLPSSLSQSKWNPPLCWTNFPCDSLDSLSSTQSASVQSWTLCLFSHVLFPAWTTFVFWFFALKLLYFNNW